MPTALRRPQAAARPPASSPDRLLDEGFEEAARLERAGRIADAQAIYAAILTVAPRSRSALLRSAAGARALGRLDLSERLLVRATANDPQDADAWNDLAVTLIARDRLDAARHACERALAAAAQRLDARINLSAVERACGRFERAERWCREVLAARPDARDAKLNLAGLLAETGRVREGIATLDALLARDPDDAEARWTRVALNLFAGDLDAGWRDFESRWAVPAFAGGLRPHRQPRWADGGVAGRRILVWREQGLGDEILFSSMVPDLATQAGAVVLECEPRLVALFRRSFPGVAVVACATPADPRTEDADIELQAPLASLARVLRPTHGHFPRRRGHLAADQEARGRWHDWLARLGPGLKVGVCWRSSDLTGERRLACATIDQWAPVLRTQGMQFVNLQYDECTDELARAAGRIHVPPGLDQFADIDGTAALIAELDLVVTAPTTVSLLAGALGVRTWQLTCGVDWHCLGAEHNPWLPAIERFWRPWNRTWDDILGEVAQALAGYRGAAGAPARN